MQIEVCRTTKPGSKLVLLSILFVSIGLYFWSVVRAQEIAIGFCVLSMASFLLHTMLIKNVPVLVIDDAGVFDARLGVSKIWWSEVEKVSFEASYGNRFLCLHMREPEKIVSKLNGDKKDKVLFHQQLGFKTFNIDIGQLQVSLLDLKTLIESNIHRTV